MVKRRITFEFDDDETYRGLQKASDPVRAEFSYLLLSAMLDGRAGFYIAHAALARFGVSVVPAEANT